ncbi:hypothetical protein M514_02317 [Trichuris suis]|uniref:Uncharacterized protein n=1 Tax=Trichuris suis TaxID=68888 RepID=A0A085MHE5_9BILA|nr:hypothetical protein M513_02317 [Trichuris suis]KFD66816.1 hypothetical protein M514_02317 [Trichuris suis]
MIDLMRPVGRLLRRWISDSARAATDGCLVHPYYSGVDKIKVSLKGALI